MTLPYQTHSLTSRAAADQAAGRAPTERARVLAYLQAQGEQGATDEEMQQALGMNPSTQRPRRVELCQKGLVFPTTRMRPTRSNRQAVVWLAANPATAPCEIVRQEDGQLAFVPS